MTTPPSSPPPLLDRRAAFTEAVRFIDGQQFAAAAVRLQTLLHSYPELEDYHLYHLGVAWVGAGRAEQAAPLLRRLLEAHPRSVWRDRAALALGRIEARRDNFEASRRALIGAADSRDSRVARQARLERALVDAAAGDVAGAAVTLQQLRGETPGQGVGIKARIELERLRAEHPGLVPNTAPMLIDEIALLLSEGELVAANALATDLLLHAAPKRRGMLLRLQARALLGLRRVDDAIAALRSSTRGESAAMKALIQFRVASMLWNLDRDEAALAEFTRLRRRYPRARQLPEALYAIGRIHEISGRFDQAVAAYRELTKMPGRGRLGGEARWRIAWVEYGRQRWRAAEERFAAMARCRSIEPCVDAIYWLARTREHRGRQNAARNLYRRIIDAAPSSYYAMWAERRLGLAARPPTAVVPPKAEPLPATTEYHLQRARELQALGLRSLALRELVEYEREQAGNPAELRPLLSWYPAVDGHAAALRLARRLGLQAGLNRESRRRLLYPLGYWSIIQAATGGPVRPGENGSQRASIPTTRLDPLLVSAVIRQESMYDPEARSPANAHGLMQLLPATASEVAGAPVAASELSDPQRNITLGARYLARLLAKYQGDELKALAAYNGGEAAVEKWQRRSAGCERDEFVETISFRETRDYVKKVVASYREYQRLYTVGNGSTGSDRPS